MITNRLQTDRLSLLPMNEGDLEVFHKTNINPFVREFLWDDQQIPKSLSEEILIEVKKRFNNEKWGLWKIVDSNSGHYMGYIGFWFFFDEQIPQLLYALLPEYTGNGYATEAGAKIIKYAFEYLNFDYLIATMDKPNKGSVNVCKRLNMSFVEEKEIENKPILFYRLNNRIINPNIKDKS